VALLGVRLQDNPQVFRSLTAHLVTPLTHTPTHTHTHTHVPTRCSPSRKLFRYIAGDADTPTAGLPTQSPYARGPIGGDDSAASTLASPTRMLRKIPRAPFKVGRPPWNVCHPND
jgi:hypothetical protein